MKDFWVVYKGEKLLAGDYVKVEIERSKFERVELCGLDPTQKGVWNVLSNGNRLSTQCNQKDIRLINKNINYYNLRLRECTVAIMEWEQYKLELESMKLELMRKGG